MPRAPKKKTPTPAEAAATFTVASDRLVGHDRGATVSANDLDGINVEALVAAGHLTPGTPGTDETNDNATGGAHS